MYDPKEERRLMGVEEEKPLFVSDTDKVIKQKLDEFDKTKTDEVINDLNENQKAANGLLEGNKKPIGEKVAVMPEPDRERYKVGINELFPNDPEATKEWEAIDYINSIDNVIGAIKKYSKVHRAKSTPREWFNMWIDIEEEFGEWSATINTTVRNVLKLTTDEIVKGIDVDVNNFIHAQFSWVYSYWWNRFSYMRSVLETKSSVGGISKIKRIEKVASILKNMIKGDLHPADVDPNFNKLVEETKFGLMAHDINENKQGNKDDKKS